VNQKLTQLYNQIPKSACPPDCGKCCGILYPSTAEVNNIKNWCIQHKIEFKEFHMNIDLDCPYLSKEKQCIIYPVRPFLCRMMGVSDLKCPLGLCKPDKVLNHAVSGWIYTQIYLKGKEKPKTDKHVRLLNKMLVGVVK
jgi:hypothetical protein